MSALARVGQRLMPMVRHVADSGNHIAPSMWKKFGSDLYDNIPRFFILIGAGAVAYVVNNFDKRIDTSRKEAKEDINRLEDNLGVHIDRLENRIDALGKETREAMGKLSDRLDGRIDASGKESREAMGKLSDKIDASRKETSDRIDASRKETNDKIDLQTKIILEVLNKRSWW